MNGIDYTNDPRAVLIHFNPNHDKLGRFAESRFGGSKSSTKYVDKSESVEYNNLRSVADKSVNNYNIKKHALIGGIAVATALTIAGIYLYKSGRFNDLKDKGLDILYGSINLSDKPSYNGLPKIKNAEHITETIKNTNPNFGKMEYDANCTSCSIAAFLRQKGCNVKAGKTPGGARLVDMISECFDVGDTMEDRDLFNLTAYTTKTRENETTAEKVSRMLIRKFGENASGVVGVSWGGVNVAGDGIGGHAFNWEIKDGIVTFFDGQNPDGSRNDDFCRNVIWPNVDPNKPFQAYRLDHLIPKIGNIKKVLE